MILKTVDNSVFSSKEIEELTFLFGMEKGEPQVYTTALLSLCRRFLPTQEHTNNIINNKIFFDWNLPNQYVVFSLDKWGAEKFAFSLGDEIGKESKSYIPLISNRTINYTADNTSEIGTTQRFELASSDTVRRIKEFFLLEENWDSYGALPIKWSVIIRAINFFSKIVFSFHNAPIPFVSPVNDGSIYFEWETCSKLLKHYIPVDENSAYEYLEIDKSSGELIRHSDKADTKDEMLEIISNWILNL